MEQTPVPDRGPEAHGQSGNVESSHRVRVPVGRGGETRLAV
jgi:hypothetical protein